MNESISLIIPTYNECNTIIPLIEKLADVLSGQDYEIIIVDDNSPDGTAELVKPLGNSYPISLFVRRAKKGLATAVIKGFEFATGQICGVMDADFQHPPDMLPKMLHEIKKGSDLVVASRYVPGGQCLHWSKKRTLVSRAAVLLAHLFLPQTKMIQDPLSGFFMFRKDRIEHTQLRPKGYKILLELLMTKKFTNISEVPFIFRKRTYGKSKFSVKQGLEYLHQLYRLRGK